MGVGSGGGCRFDATSVVVESRALIRQVENIWVERRNTKWGDIFFQFIRDGNSST